MIIHLLIEKKQRYIYVHTEKKQLPETWCDICFDCVGANTSISSIMCHTPPSTEEWGENHKWLETQNGAAKKIGGSLGVLIFRP